jgi:hypothetical protein
MMDIFCEVIITLIFFNPHSKYVLLILIMHMDCFISFITLSLIVYLIHLL